MTRVWVAQLEESDDVLGVLEEGADLAAFARSWWHEEALREPGERLDSLAGGEEGPDRYELEVLVSMPDVANGNPVSYAVLVFRLLEVRSC